MIAPLNRFFPLMLGELRFSTESHASRLGAFAPFACAGAELTQADHP
jgi:hypothetical protein